MIYVDLDGVACNWLKRAEEILGRPWGGNKDWKILTRHPNLYQDLEMFPDFMDMWNHLIPHKPVILTAIPSIGNLPLAEKHKREWVAKHLGPEVVMLIGPYSPDKQNHCKPGDILIDDYVLNIAQWSSKGGIGICHKNAATSIKCLKYFKL